MVVDPTRTCPVCRVTGCRKDATRKVGFDWVWTPPSCKPATAESELLLLMGSGVASLDSAAVDVVVATAGKHDWR